MSRSKRGRRRRPTGSPVSHDRPTARPEGSRGSRRELGRSYRTLAWVSAIAGVVLVALATYQVIDERSTAPRAIGTPPTRVTSADYADNAQCLQCHPTAARNWAGSHHARAMALATADTVLADFGNTTFAHAGVTSRFFKR